MLVYVLIREDQNEHGYVDTSITGVFQDENVARQHVAEERQRAAAHGLIVESDDSPDGEWQVAWAIDEHVVSLGRLMNSCRQLHGLDNHRKELK